MSFVSSKGNIFRLVKIELYKIFAIFVSSKGNIFRLVKIELYKIFAIINRAIKGLHCNVKIVIQAYLFTSAYIFPLEIHVLHWQHSCLLGLHPTNQ